MKQKAYAFTLKTSRLILEKPPVVVSLLIHEIIILIGANGNLMFSVF